MNLRKILIAEQAKRTTKLVRELFPVKYPRFRGKKYESILCANRLAKFIRDHEERNKVYRKLAYELMRTILSSGLSDEQITAAVYELRGIYSIMQFTSPLSARALLKEIHMYLSTKKTHTK